MLVSDLTANGPGTDPSKRLPNLKGLQIISPTSGDFSWPVTQRITRYPRFCSTKLANCVASFISSSGCGTEQPPYRLGARAIGRTQVAQQQPQTAYHGSSSPEV